MARLDAEVFDLRGLKCPLPVLKTKKRLASLQKGETLTVETSDPLAVIDIPHLCREDQHELLESAKTETGHRFIIRKG
ncbi:sulfurtransferase TusA family protein [Rhizobium tubonense]|uniref:Response regulator SirA n=1 Tax=Rhizobium tubonense TaxID=484088 RepID=A0A2W4EDH6_9HYPH|nr:sulfurtransferase TusA family protein [Rhizobium tubonense]PZM09510.1 response regulator SirA [Rhizobium tubonense]